jgi:predicted nucleic acid-binding protein
MVRRRQIPDTGADEIYLDIIAAVEHRMRIVPAAEYAAKEGIARRPIPRDSDDWPTVALALALEADIWTHDRDFFGCGVATWTTETLLLHLTA